MTTGFLIAITLVALFRLSALGRALRRAPGWCPCPVRATGRCPEQVPAGFGRGVPGEPYGRG